MTSKIWNPRTTKRASCSQFSIEPEQERTLLWWSCRLLRRRQPRLAWDSQAQMPWTQGPSPAVQWLCPLQQSLLLWTKQVKLTQPSTSSPLFPDFKQQRFVSLKYLHVKRTDWPLYTHSGRSCGRRHQVLGQLHGPGSNSARRRRGHWGTWPTRPLHLYTPTALLCLCATSGGKTEPHSPRYSLSQLRAQPEQRL